MSSNFRLFLNDTRENIHIKVWGDFINLSVHNFIGLTQAQVPKSNQIIVYAEYLNNIYSFKLKLIRKNKKNLNIEIMEYEGEIVPLENNGGTRSGINRRQYNYSSYIPERRFRERRCKNIGKENVLRMRKTSNETQIFLEGQGIVKSKIKKLKFNSKWQISHS